MLARLGRETSALHAEADRGMASVLYGADGTHRARPALRFRHGLPARDRFGARRVQALIGLQRTRSPGLRIVGWRKSQLAPALVAMSVSCTETSMTGM